MSINPPRNPFYVRQILPARFYGGYGNALRVVSDRLAQEPAGSTAIVGANLSGRTSLLRYLASAHAREQHPEMAKYWPVYYSASLGAAITANTFWAEVLQEVERVLRKATAETRDPAERAGTEEVCTAAGAALARAQDGRLTFTDVLRIADTAADAERRLLLLVDDFDQLLRNPSLMPPANNEFFGQLRNLVNRDPLGLVLIVATQRRIKQLWGRPGGSIFYNTFLDVVLGRLEDDEVGAILDCMLAGTGVSFTPKDIDALHRYSGNMPAYVQFYAWLIFDGHVQGQDELARLARARAAAADRDGVHYEYNVRLTGQMDEAELLTYGKAITPGQKLSDGELQLLREMRERGGLPPEVKI